MNVPHTGGWFTAPMYTSYYGFKKKPFQAIPDPSLFFMSRCHADTYSHLEYALMEDKGFVVVTGEPGSGKTSLINVLVKEHGASLDIRVLVPNHGPSAPFMAKVCRTFGLTPNGHDAAGMLWVFRNLLAERRSNGHRMVIIVDEADTLTDTDLEQIRILANLERDKHYLVQVILVGRPGLKKKILENKTSDFVRRVTVSSHITGLQRNEVASYLRHCLQSAGGSHNLGLFDQEATESIYEHSRGIPKVANIISDAALICGYADERKKIGKEVVDEVVKDTSTGETTHRRPLSAPGGTRIVDWKRDKEIRWDIEKQVHVLENTIRRINQALHSRNSATIRRDEVMCELTPIMKRMENQLNLLLENVKILIE